MADIDLSKPLDLSKFGTSDDPCFGKLHDLTAPECKRCGDADICAIVTLQNQHKVRQLESNNTRFKDVEEGQTKTEAQPYQKYIKKLNDTGTKSYVMVRKVIAKYGIHKKLAKKYVKECTT